MSWPILRVYYYLGKSWADFGNFYALGQVFIETNGKMLKNNLAIWSHCFHPSFNFLSKTCPLKLQNINLKDYQSQPMIRLTIVYVQQC